MKATITILLFLATCLSACHFGKVESVKTPIPTPPEAMPIVTDTPAVPPGPQYTTDPLKMSIIAFTDTLYNGDTLKIRFKTPHPKDLGIMDPDGKIFYLVHKENTPVYPSLVNWNSFADMDHLNLVSKTKAPLLDSLARGPIAIFTKSGTYRLIITPNLEISMEPLELHKVYYVDSKKR